MERKSEIEMDGRSWERSSSRVKKLGKPMALWLEIPMVCTMDMRMVVLRAVERVVESELMTEMTVVDDSVF